MIGSHCRTATSQAISGLPNSAKVYKGYSSYEEAHAAWDGFAFSGRLPIDVAVSLGSRQYPTPPILPAAPRVTSPPTTPQHTQAYNHHSASASPLRSRTPGTQHSRPSVTPPFGFSSPRTPRVGNRLDAIASPSPSSSQISAAAALIVREESFRADLEDFWVVFTGPDPGVHQGR